MLNLDPAGGLESVAATIGSFACYCFWKKNHYFAKYKTSKKNSENNNILIFSFINSKFMAIFKKSDYSRKKQNGKKVVKKLSKSCQKVV
jgi:hypothetical protein